MPQSNPSQQFVPIQKIVDNVVEFKDGSSAMILLATSINFALKSSDEQRAILSQFQNFLNTLDFSVQIYIQSRRLDITPYLEILEGRTSDQENDLMRIQLREYMQFIKAFTTEVDVMAKNFFVVVPYSNKSVELSSSISSFFGGGNKQGNQKELIFEEKRLQLEQRASLVEQGLNRIGVRTLALENEALVELYYHIMNPQEVGREAPQL